MMPALHITFRSYAVASVRVRESAFSYGRNKSNATLCGVETSYATVFAHIGCYSLEYDRMRRNATAFGRTESYGSVYYGLCWNADACEGNLPFAIVQGPIRSYAIQCLYYYYYIIIISSSNSMECVGIERYTTALRSYTTAS